MSEPKIEVTCQIYWDQIIRIIVDAARRMPADRLCARDAEQLDIAAQMVREILEHQ